MSFVEQNARMAKEEFQHPKQEPDEAGRLRLDALTIAGLTGTPHQGNSSYSSSRFFGSGTGARAAGSGARASPGSPSGSDATLGSIQDSACGDGEVCWLL